MWKEAIRIQFEALYWNLSAVVEENNKVVHLGYSMV
jgi:hypothetical protein